MSSLQDAKEPTRVIPADVRDASLNGPGGNHTDQQADSALYGYNEIPGRLDVWVSEVSRQL